MTPLLPARSQRVAASAEKAGAARWWTHERLAMFLAAVAIVAVYGHSVIVLVDALGQILRAA